ncbi:hypothetical protein OIU34_22325 [Pararhizobium sp. BT-229]|uniref:hypothetical protein n=1 Tax=Pararhizobium sp. BT-229 TaxID=2986923 RepID=UPI0021F6CBDE|nr:hypothetical protein [Pararhizobium sp. BT-229]MCV9964631.1 hypothetical protein [Pararhizobium sp. BT-229]
MTTASPSREDAFEKAMKSFHDIDMRFGSDNPDYPSIDRMMGGYRGFAERVVGEAFVRIDASICPLIEAAEEGTDVAITGATLSNIRHVAKTDGTTEHVATVLDANGNPAFRLEFNPRAGHGDRECVVNDISVVECPVDDPEYPYSDRIASAHVGRPDGEDGANGLGYAEYSGFAKFVVAMDILKPFVAANLDKVDYGKPFGNRGLTFSQINMISYLPALEFDGGLPGKLCLDVSDTMALSGAGRAFRFMSSRLGDTIRGLNTRGADFGTNYLSFNDMDYLACTVPGPDGAPSAVLVTQINLVFNHDSFLAWNVVDKDGTPTETHLVALERGRKTLDAVNDYMAGDTPEGPAASYSHADATVNLPREFMETSVLSTAPFSVGYTLETLRKRRGRIRDFKEMLETHEDIEEPASPGPNAPLL